MTRYAEQTQVPADRSRAEIEKTLSRYGADSFAYAWDRDRAVIMFTANNRQIRMAVPIPDPQDASFTRTPTGRSRTAAQAKAEHEKAVRQRWRALALVVKAKLEAVDTGLISFDQEFAVFTVLPDGSTVGDHLIPAIEKAYVTGTVPPMLALGPS